jgi:hypothetical protein
MFEFVYFVIYTRSIQNGKSTLIAKYNAFIASSFGILTLVGAILAIARRVFRDWCDDHLGHASSTLLMLVLAVHTGFCVLYFSKRRVERILMRYESYENPTSLINHLKVAGIIFIPLVVSFFVSK